FKGFHRLPNNMLLLQPDMGEPGDYLPTEFLAEDNILVVGPEFGEGAEAIPEGVITFESAVHGDLVKQCVNLYNQHIKGLTVFSYGASYGLIEEMDEFLAGPRPNQ